MNESPRSIRPHDRLSRRNGLAPTQSEWFGYDRADRLTGMTRGKARRTLGPAPQGAPPKPLTVDFEQRWTLDAMDNWERFKQDDSDCRITSMRQRRSACRDDPRLEEEWPILGSATIAVSLVAQIMPRINSGTLCCHDFDLSRRFWVRRRNRDPYVATQGVQETK
jgi:hypothetical protein